MGCATSKADQEAAALPPPQAGAPTKAAADTAAAPAQTSTGPSTASPFANAPADHQQVGGAARQDDELGEARSIEWNALDRPSMPALKGNSHSYRRTSTDSKVGFAVDPETAPCAERSTSRQSFQIADSVSMHKIVDMFYEKVLADPELKHFFDNSSMDRIKQHQARVLNAAFEGKEFSNPEDWDIDLHKTHLKLMTEQGLNQLHWDRFFQHLEETLGELPTIPLATRRTALQSIRTTRTQFSL